uniref:AraC family transcriptional regulator n=1 Tax=Heterorhabditis bacteriophora TaxID=37862 RepID=A0A1I7X1R6_HETBA
MNKKLTKYFRLHSEVDGRNCQTLQKG